MIPGMGAFNLYKRLGRTAQEFREGHPEEGMSSMVPEYAGRFTAPILSGGLGALLGAGAGSLVDNAEAGAMIGGGAGALLPSLIGALTAAGTPTRGPAEQLEAERTPGWKNLLYPGFAEHNYWKRLGYSRRYDDKADANEAAELLEAQAG